MQRLPAEMRMLIYRELLLDKEHYLEPQGKNPDNEPYTSKVYPAILRVCKQFYAEASAVLYEENTFGYEYRNECIRHHGPDLYHADNPPRGPFKRIKHLQMTYFTKRVDHPCHTASKLTAVVKHVANLGCALKTLFLQLRFGAEDMGAAARIAQAMDSRELIEALAELNVNKQFKIYLDSDRVSKCKVLEAFANEIGILKGWAISLTTETLLPYEDYIKNRKAEDESDEEDSNEEVSDDEASDVEGADDDGAESDSDELPSANDPGSNLQEQDDRAKRHEDDPFKLLDYEKKHDNWNNARYVWTWILKPATTSTQKDVPTTSKYMDGRRHP